MNTHLQPSERLFMKMVMLFLFFLVSGCATVDNIQDLLTKDEMEKKEYYKCTQGVSIDFGGASNAGSGVVMGAGLSIMPFLSAPMVFSNMHYKKTAGSPLADIDVDDAVRIATISSYFSVQGYCRTLACDQPGKDCLEVDTKLFGYNRDAAAAVEVTITKTPSGPETIREYTTYRKVSLKGRDIELTEISRDEALRIRDYYENDYFIHDKGAAVRP
jgi:hypothetical protein